jgi:hypothetical protein
MIRMEDIQYSILPDLQRTYGIKDKEEREDIGEQGKQERQGNRRRKRGKRGTHCNENPIYVFLFWELRDLSPNFHIHVSVRDLYIPRIGPHISCSRIGRSIAGYLNRSQTHECGNCDCGRAFPFLGIYVSNFLYWFFAVRRYKRNRGGQKEQSKEGRNIRHIGEKEEEEGGGRGGEGGKKERGDLRRRGERHLKEPGNEKREEKKVRKGTQ